MGKTITIDAQNGIRETEATSEQKCQFNLPCVGVSPFAMQIFAHVGAAAAQTDSIAASSCGVHTITSSEDYGPVTCSLPAASTCVGSRYVFRSLSPQEHTISASSDAAGSRRILYVASGSEAWESSHRETGSRLKLAKVVGASVIMDCDGVNWYVTAGSGSHTVENV